MDSPFVEKAIPMVSVDQSSGSKYPYMQNTYSPRKPPTSLEPSTDLLESYRLLDSIELANLTYSTEFSSTGATVLESAPLSIHAPKVSGVGEHPSKEHHQMVNKSTLLSSILKELAPQTKTKPTTPKYSLWLYSLLAASSTTQSDPSTKTPSKISAQL